MPNNRSAANKCAEAVRSRLRFDVFGHFWLGCPFGFHLLLRLLAAQRQFDNRAVRRYDLSDRRNIDSEDLVAPGIKQPSKIQPATIFEIVDPIAGDTASERVEALNLFEF